MLKHDTYKIQYDQRGFAILPMLNNLEVNELKKLYSETSHEAGIDQPFYTTIWSKNKPHRQKIDSHLKQVIGLRLKDILTDFQLVFGNFMVKHPGVESSLIPHQDWAFVEEPQFDSMTIWIPLSDVSETNGTLQIIPGSQYTKNYIRGRFFENPLTPFNEFLQNNRMTGLEMKAGEALFLNSRLVHASPPNLSNETRVVASMVVAPANTQFIHYFFDRSNQSPTLKKAKVSSNFFTDFHCFELPSVEAEEIPYVHSKLYFSEDDLSIIKNARKTSHGLLQQ